VRALTIALLIAAVAATTGCIRRKMVITTEPPGAMVTLNNTYRGRTPIDIPFTVYWKYQIGLEREGYKPMTQMEHLRARPWLLEPLEFFFELMPFRVRDTRRLHYVMELQDPLI
jgi:hypothetical protein